MPEQDPLILQYSHLKGYPRENEALHTLKKIASLVKPIMRARNWKVGTLAEFWPDQQNLLGINQNRGQKICLRLRYPTDKNQFLPLEQVVDTMLHELAHNVFGPHDAKFHALWDQQRKEYAALISKGYTGEGFMSDGHKLGGRKIPRHEATRIARAAAEKRRTLYAGSGQKLGGAPIRAGTDIRKVIVDAIERRNTVLKGCGSGENNVKEINDLADSATRNGFRTQAEEDEANERAISQALWELVQEDQKKEYGDDYVPTTVDNPTGNGGGEIGLNSLGPKKKAVTPETSTIPTRAGSGSKAPSQPTPGSRPSRPMSRLVDELSPETKSISKKAKLEPKGSSISSNKPTSSSNAANVNPKKPKAETDTVEDVSLTGWTCPICTLHNPTNFLCCDACTTERPEEFTRRLVEVARPKPPVPTPSTRAEWRCRSCTTIMEDKWWTCSTCGRLKESS
ncbi:zinc metallopeptidase [Phlyctema vagabunda]|uniref:Zinc metallopeptidase n=1 Tax=Phlyctema vagabunda TaxID=108571 RepID=A0ABR4PPT6_9HELO